ncbi:MAG: hypothetical protein ICV68_14785 [Pyrinomonadaceae bacterium]|nr:hypothetical protein [Pyrinomonadaceae bacterium]
MSMANGPRDNDESNEATRAVTEAAGNRAAPDQVEAITQIVLKVVKNLQEGETQKGWAERSLRLLGWIVASWAFFCFFCFLPYLLA